MATGYTHKVQDGTLTEFSEFAMLCARAFGATIMMRDEPLDAQIPDEFRPETEFYDRALEAARKRLYEAQSLSMEACAKAAKVEHERAVQAWKDRATRRAEERERYASMLRKVEKWQPPTEEHAGLKKFMLQQLNDSMSFDCGGTWDAEPKGPLSAEAWRDREIADARGEIVRNTNRRQEEIDRAEGRTRWMRELRQSLVQCSTGS